LPIAIPWSTSPAWGAIAGVIQILAYLVARLTLPQLTQDIPAGTDCTGDLSGGRFAHCRPDQRRLHDLLSTHPPALGQVRRRLANACFQEIAMALMDFIKKQFIDVIHWTEDGDGVLAMRYPMQDFEIQYGAQLTVRESQMAVFVNEGQIADVFGPGLYTLTTRTLPLLTNLKNWDKLFESPFKSDVYFFSTRLQLDCKWGTPNPITIRDKDFGMVRMRAFGIYSYKLSDVRKFHSEISGTREQYTVADLDGQLRNLVISSMTDLFGESGVPFIDMAANQDELSRTLKGKLASVFERYGLTLDSFVVQNVSLPEELQKILDSRIGMNMLGDLGRYTQYQVANSIPLAAQNEGGIAGIGAGLGAGLGIGQTMTAVMAQTMPAGTAPAVQPAASASAAGNADEVVATLEKLHGLVAKGILSQAEFDAKKAELLGKLV
jgi:membrane protease subunit (stomatin/prohibitin family)